MDSMLVVNTSSMSIDVAEEELTTLLSFPCKYLQFVMDQYVSSSVGDCGKHRGVFGGKTYGQR